MALICQDMSIPNKVINLRHQNQQNTHHYKELPAAVVNSYHDTPHSIENKKKHPTIPKTNSFAPEKWGLLSKGWSSPPSCWTKVTVTPKILQPTVNQSCVSAQKMKRLENQSQVLVSQKRQICFKVIYS